MTRKGVHNVPDFSSRKKPRSPEANPPAEQQKQVSQQTTPSNPKPHSTSMKSGRRGS